MGYVSISIQESKATSVYSKEASVQKIEVECDGNETFPAAYDSGIVTDLKDIAVLLRRMGDELNNRNTHINQYTSKSRSKSVPSFIEYLQSSCRESADECRERLQREVHEVFPFLKGTCKVIYRRTINQKLEKREGKRGISWPSINLKDSSFSSTKLHRVTTSCQCLIPCIEEFTVAVFLYPSSTKITISFNVKKACVCNVSINYPFQLVTKAESNTKMSFIRKMEISYLQLPNLVQQKKVAQDKSCRTCCSEIPEGLAKLLKKEKYGTYKCIVKGNVERKREIVRRKATDSCIDDSIEKVSIKRFVESTAFKIHPVKITVGRVDGLLARYFTPNPPTKRETMAYELLRLCTLHDFPKSTGQSCIRLAQAGFFYEGKDDEVTCFSCTIQICGWQRQDIPLDRHRKTSPSCLFIKCQDSGNVPIGALETAEASTLAVKSNGDANIASSKANFVLEKPASNNESKHQTASSSAVGNFVSTASRKSGSPYESGYGSKSGSSSQPSDSCNTSNSQSYITASESSSRTGISYTQTAIQYTVTSTNRNKAHYPEYVLVSDRLQSFNRGWPDYVQQTPQMMVESGFFFAGYDDCVRCFQCGIGLRNWEPPDSPHVEHARWSPKCPFLLRVKGQDFINLVLDAVAQLAIRNEQSEQTANNPPAHMESNPAKAALLQTSQQIQERNTTAKNPAKTGVSARNDGTGSLNTPSQTNTSATNTGSSQSDLKTEGAKKVLQKGFSEKEVREAINKLVEKEGWSNVTEERILKTIQEEKQKERLRPPGLRGGDATAKAPALAPDIMELKNKNREMREMTICKICLEEEVSFVFLPCGHLIACAQCAPALSRCAVCRKPITGTVCAHLDV